MSGTGKVDLRVQKTERALMEAMMVLLKNKPFEDITVSDLCQAATVRRATFYKHYRDKYDFLDFCIEKKRQAFEQSTCTFCGALSPLDETMAMLQMVLTALRANESFPERGACGPLHGPMSLFARYVNRSMERNLLEIQQSGTELHAPPALIASFLSGALLQTCHWYYADGDGLSEEAFLHSVRQMLSLCMPTMTDNKGGSL